MSRFLIVDRCDSTQELLKARLLEIEPKHWHGDTVISNTQSFGRGRHGAHWMSEEGGIYMSVAFKFDQPWGALQTWLGPLVGLSVHQWLSGYCGAYAPILKWPNDLVVDRYDIFSKLGGILIESFQHGAFVVGVGINVSVTPVVEGRATVSLMELSPDAHDPRGLAAELSQTLVRDFPRELHTGMGVFFDKCSEFKNIAWPQVGTEIQWSAGVGGVEKSMRGVAIGFGASGELFVEAEPGKRLALFSDEVARVTSAAT